MASVLLTGCGTLGIGKSKTESNTRAVSKAQAPNMGVNSFLWRASLETLNFMPLAQVDPFGGVIVTDWYASAEAPNERFKANVYILDTNLRADALSLSKPVQRVDGKMPPLTPIRRARLKIQS